MEHKCTVCGNIYLDYDACCDESDEARELEEC